MPPYATLEGKSDEIYIIWFLFFQVQKDGGEEGLWIINAKEGKGKIEFNGKDKPDVTFIVKDADIIELLTGKIQPQRAFFQGKVKIQGNMGLAMKLTGLQQTAAAKIEALRNKHLKSKL